MNRRHALGGAALVAASAILAAWRLAPVAEVAHEPLGVGPAGGATLTAAAATLTVPGGTLPDMAPPTMMRGGRRPSLEDAWDGATKWRFNFEIDRSLVYQRGYPRALPGATTQYFGSVLGPGHSPIDLGRLDLPVEGPASLTFRSAPLNGSLDGSTLVLSSSPDHGAASPRVYFGSGVHSSIARPLGPRDEVGLAGEGRERQFELGRLALLPIPRLGIVRVEPRKDVGELELHVAPFGLTPELLGQFGRPIPGGLRAMTSNGGQVEAFSYAVDTKWSARLKVKGGRLLASVEAQRGTDLVIEYVQPQGLVLSVDLSRTPDARRIIVVPAAAASAMILENAAYEEHVQGALRTAAVPLPRFRGPQQRYTTGLLEMEDGALRVEVWARKDEARWQRMVMRLATVAGDVVEVFL